MLTSSRYVYQSHGLLLLSPFPIPELNPTGLPLTQDNQVEISLTTDPEGFPYPHLDHSGYLITAETAILCVPKQIVFFIAKGRSIQILTHADVEMNLLCAYLVGNVLALLLTQRGYLVLHACSVEIGSKAIAVMGSSGAGKSSLAAALVKAGHRFCNDDLSPLLFQDNQPLLWPGYSQIKLYEEVIQTLRLNHQQLSPLHQCEEKWGYRNRPDLCSTALPLRCIYLGLAEKS